MHSAIMLICIFYYYVCGPVLKITVHLRRLPPAQTNAVKKNVLDVLSFDDGKHLSAPVGVSVCAGVALANLHTFTSYSTQTHTCAKSTHTHTHARRVVLLIFP